VLASYRGYDTWGEVTVIFTAGIGVMLLLGASAAVRGKLFTDREQKTQGEDRQ
jgi:multicomponent Na+:H+ antiporter subunit B